MRSDVKDINKHLIRMRLICLCCKVIIQMCVESEIVHIIFFFGPRPRKTFNVLCAIEIEWRKKQHHQPGPNRYNIIEVLQHHQKSDMYGQITNFTRDYAYFTHISVSLKFIE